jgi:hypothetical protein
MKFTGQIQLLKDCLRWQPDNISTLQNEQIKLKMSLFHLDNVTTSKAKTEPHEN